MRSRSLGGNFLRALVEDRAGNTLVIAAASLIPMTALIGGGVDVGRAYMAKTQLQAACDAGVLAGRRAMSKTGSYGTSEKAKANSMFTFNFDPVSFDATNVSYVTHDNDDGQVLGTASARVPTLVMKIFDMRTVDLSVDCMAELQIGNADVMFVLDTTGSMGNSINWGEPTKIEGLRAAVRDFHKTINQAVNDNRTRIRYGFVPYSMTVNVKDLLQSGEMPYEFMADSTNYQSRLAVFNTPVYEEHVQDLGTTNETYPYAISSNNCTKYGDNRYPSSGSNPDPSGTAPNPVTTKEYDYVSWTKTGKSGGTNVGTCVRRVWTTRTTYTLDGYKFTTWRYSEAPIDTSRVKRFDSVAVATNVSNAIVQSAGAYDPVRLAQMSGSTATGVGTTNYTWSGCIEERKTITPEVTLPNLAPLPEDAFDLSFDLVPYDRDSSWKPHWNPVEYSRSNYDYEDSTSNRSTASSSCPSPMMMFRNVELSDDPNNVPDWLNTYLNNLVATGNTYHDIGMIWGGRLTSPTGLFAANVNLDSDKINVSKHVIFMTDGIMEPTASGYSAYGIENLDSRIAPRYYSNTITSRHNLRFSAMCEAIKAQGTTIWVVAFGTSMTTELQNCASNGRAYYSSNTDELRNTFKFIAAQVADLRLGA
ncbi:TadE/TadG family type IV pilus assembly protein [Erythrobacter sp. SG61-1L]|uniref:TadE/TadG family type IV pilus assembly protein n=1 Tax=Erythrobacter sp. SG61-1L TaxID=1603897 RepID=UPI000A490716|nr:TadE/TadG family type IV pilus assembly protein [Erythrobacter sp. SG61-1L]